MITADEFIQALMFLGLARQMNGSLFLSLALICKFSTLTLRLSYLSFDPSPSLDNHLPPPPHPLRRSFLPFLSMLQKLCLC